MTIKFLILSHVSSRITSILGGFTAYITNIFESWLDNTCIVKTPARALENLDWHFSLTFYRLKNKSVHWKIINNENVVSCIPLIQSLRNIIITVNQTNVCPLRKRQTIWKLKRWRNCWINIVCSHLCVPLENKSVWMSCFWHNIIFNAFSGANENPFTAIILEWCQKSKLTAKLDTKQAMWEKVLHVGVIWVKWTVK